MKNVKCNHSQPVCIRANCPHAVLHNDCNHSGFSRDASYPMECPIIHDVVQCVAPTVCVAKRKGKDE